MTIKQYLGHIYCALPFTSHEITEEEEDALTVDKQRFRCRRCFCPVEAWISVEDSLKRDDYYWIQEVD